MKKKILQNETLFYSKNTQVVFFSINYSSTSPLPTGFTIFSAVKAMYLFYSKSNVMKSAQILQNILFSRKRKWEFGKILLYW